MSNFQMLRSGKSVLIIEAHGTLQRRQNLCAWLDHCEPAGDHGVWQQVGHRCALEPAELAIGSRKKSCGRWQDAARCSKWI